MSKVTTFVKETRVVLTQGAFLFALFMLFLSPLNAFAADLAASGKQTIKDTFGSGSTVMYALFVLEILSGVFFYIKTKNLAVLGGIVALLIFTTVAFGLI